MISRTNGLPPNERPKPLAVTVGNARELLGIGETKMWELIAQKRVATFNIGRRRLVVFESLEKLLPP
jgi:hypothetical protein